MIYIITLHDWLSPGSFASQVLFIAGNHLEEFLDQTRIRIQLDVRGQDKVGERRIAGNVATHIHRIQKLLLRLVQMARAHVKVRRWECAVVAPI